ncbi:MAG: hypothetical protein LBU66_06030, partial [Treponema sp.]|nr:hypothetical protein [Treponema sp.]
DSKKKDGGRKGSEGHVTRSSFGVDLSNARGPDRRHAQLGISMKFKSTNTPEMLCRLVDKINNATDAYPVKEDKQAQNEVDEG